MIVFGERENCTFPPFKLLFLIVFPTAEGCTQRRLSLSPFSLGLQSVYVCPRQCVIYSIPRHPSTWKSLRIRSANSTPRSTRNGSHSLTQVLFLYHFYFLFRCRFTILEDFSLTLIIDGDGRITGNDAIAFFAMSNLSRNDLKQVWAIADSRRQGYLGFREFVTAMQLVALGQAGNEINQDALAHADLDKLNPPVMEGLDTLLSNASISSVFSLLLFNAVNTQLQSPKVQWFGSKSAKKIPLSSVTSIIDGLKRLYIQKLKPLEVTYRFNDFASPLLTNSDFDAKPMVMLLGQYSTGKTTFIKHLLKSGYPGAHIGPEPTTDRFVVVMSGPDERTVPGNTIAVQADMPFNGLTTFGTAFLSKFECSQMRNPLLEHITFVDTPGVLSGEKQRTQRSYDFTGVISWFAAKCDLILLLFDPHKLDISDEFKRVISSLRGHDDKIRVVLNKADQVDTQQLMRVYGALMWSLGKVLNTPEVARVYIGSFNDKPINEAAVGPLGKELFEKEQDDLLADLKDIPKKACDRRINEFVKRARAAKIHSYIISHLKNEMPAMLGKAKAQQKLIDNLENQFAKVQREYHLPAGDFPNVEHFREVLGGYSIDKFEKLKPKMVQAVDDMLACAVSFGHSIENRLAPNLVFLRSLLGGDDRKVVSVLLTCPRLSGANPDKFPIRNLAILRGRPELDVSSLVPKSPFVLLLPPEQLEFVFRTAEESLGVGPSSKGYHVADHLSALLPREAFLRKLEITKSYGLDNHELFTMLRRSPCFLYLTYEQIRKKLDFLIGTVGSTRALLLNTWQLLFILESWCQRTSCFEACNQEDCCPQNLISQRHSPLLRRNLMKIMFTSFAKKVLILSSHI
ncbi:EH domain-containing protein 1 [Canna indica]|uniref:EH domain-containing protein 1 n=1 Tax=Canna indica TaxID=4628 RepID=A0AAQ3JQI5_9LILI|nr:EH domain-containing protein 1 [Canna indica]